EKSDVALLLVCWFGLIHRPFNFGRKYTNNSLNDNGLRMIFVIKSSSVANWLKREFLVSFLADFSS
ncbi:MAG: hypothetical protein K6A41_06495, partial [Bacteroidales bacterium]|nr:hypothetical protein [Bacteroidales bacterium]